MFMYAVEMFLYTVWDQKRRLDIRGIFVSGLNCYQFRECFRQKEVIRNTDVLAKDAIFLFYLLWQVIEPPAGVQL